MWIIRGDRDKGEWLKGYVYGNDPRSGHEFEPDEVGHWKYPNPNDQYYGLGKVEAGWDVVQQNQAQHELDTSFLKNYARPDYAVIIKGGANPEAMRKAEAELKSLVKGRNKAGSFVRFTGDVNIVPLSFPPKDLSGREEIVEEVAGVFGVPVTKMKANDPNRANAETGDAGWMRDTILPMLRMDEQKLNEWYLPLWGIEDDAFLAYEDPVPANQQEARAERESLFRVGAITVNEIRAETGREPVRASEADESLVAAGLIPLTQVGQQSGYSTPGGPSIPFTVSRPASPTVPSVPSDAPKPAAGTGIAAAAGGGDVASAGLNGAQIQALQAILEAVTAGLAAPDAAIEMIQAAFPFLKPERIQRMVHAASAFRPVNRLPDSQPQQPSERAIAQRTWRPWTDYKADADTDVRETPESVVQRYMIALDKILLSMRDEILSALDAGIPIGDAASRVLQATEVWTPQLDNAVRDVLSQGLSIGAEAAGRALGLDISFDLQRPEVQRWLSDYAAKLVRTLADEGLARRVQDVVQQGASEGIGTAEIADRIRKMDGFTDDGIANRSELIARTELANAHTQGQIEAWDQSGVVKGKRWLLAPQACPFCEAAAKIFNAENLSLRDVPEGLEKGSTLTGTNGETMKLGYRSIDSPPLHPQCRCGIEPILEGD
jgi:HK97 family phage portal protein